jgi:lipid-A-disaccharide synthase
MKIGVMCNAPGELWGWARPVVHEFKKRGHEVILWLLNCPYASGRERDVALRFGCHVIGPLNPFFAFNKLSKEKVDCVIQLGGDIFWGKLLAKNSPLLCYTYGHKKGLKACQAVFTAYEKMRDEIGYVHVIGDLVKDALKLDLNEESEEIGVWSNYSGNRVVFLPGSRENIRLKSLFYIQEIVRILSKEWEGFKPVVLFPPFAMDSELALWNESKLNPLQLGAGIVMPKADYVVTQPGTNTLEIMHCGTAGLVVAPLSFLREIPISGIGGLITKIPFLGLKLKEFVLRRKLSRYKGYVSWPNRLMNANILDELVGEVPPYDAAQRILEAFSDKNRLISTKNRLLDLSTHMGGRERSASEKLCDFTESSV